MNRKGSLPIFALILIVIIVAVAAVYMVTPAENKILIPLALFAFVVGVALADMINHILVLILGSIYWILLEIFSRLNVLEAPIISLLFGTPAIIFIGGFLLGKFLGRFVITLIFGV